LRTNIGVGVPNDQTLNTHMNVPGMEPTYVSNNIIFRDRAISE
jgi:hypothetical protein